MKSSIQAFQRVPLLAAGARVALVAPSGPLRGEGDLARAVENVRGMGWEPVVGERVMRWDGYLAGSDAERAADINWAFGDDGIDAVWCIRGGYGATRILDLLEFDGLRRKPKAVIGFSDITALHAAVGVRCGLQAFHGPTARVAFLPFTRNSFERAVIFGEDPCGVAHGGTVLRGGIARGRLAGGNISLLSAMVGTAYLPDFDDTILVLEEVDEAVYRVDRMLQQLYQSGALARVRGIVFGHCTRCDREAEQRTTDFESERGAVVRRTLDDVVRELADRLGVPCVTRFPIGHIDEQWTLPLGAIAQLDTEGMTLMVESDV